ncbi:MAG: bis(5'-nucleosyl)-tetraphosphatase [Candidatus Woesearchaeota archaeon]
MPKIRSAGGIIYNKGKYLLLHYEAGHWDLPKGMIEPGETELKAARREIEEETGIKDIFQVKGFSESESYFFKQGGRTVFKEVTFFLFESNTTEVRLSNEHKDSAWLNFHEAMSRLTYPNAKSILRKANEFLERAIRE